MENTVTSRSDLIHAKGFAMGRESLYSQQNPDYSRIKVGVKNLDDAVLSLGDMRKVDPPMRPFVDKGEIIRAIATKDLRTLRAISNFYYNTSGIYERVCNYFAFLYRYDWYVVPEIYEDSVKEDKVLKDFTKVLNFLDNSYIKKACGDIALEVIKNGAYYGYAVMTSDGVSFQ